MRRLDLLVDEDTYEALRKLAYEQRRSRAAIIREVLEAAVEEKYGKAVVSDSPSRPPQSPPETAFRSWPSGWPAQPPRLRAKLRLEKSKTQGRH